MTDGSATTAGATAPAPRVTAGHYRPLQLIGAFLTLLSGTTLAFMLAIGATEVTVPLLLIGSMGLYWLIWASSFIEGYKVREKHAKREVAELEVALTPQPATEFDHRLWRKIRARQGTGYLYALRFSSGVIKIGQTNDANRRLAEHRRDAWAYGLVVTDAWVSSAHAAYLSNEIRLMSAISGSRAKREYFHGADFDRVVAVAEELVAASIPTT